MGINARFAHINLVAHDWRTLASFYETVLGCEPVPPERNQSGEWLERATGIKDAALEGVHLRVPGLGPEGPTLEIYQYRKLVGARRTAPNLPGFGHIAFIVDDVEEASAAVRDAGGKAVGELVSTRVPGVGTLVFQYVADPEGNIIELQNWSA